MGPLLPFEQEIYELEQELARLEAEPDGEGVADAIRDNKLIPLEQLIGSQQRDKMDENTLSTFYAEGWALFHYLYRTNRAGTEKFLLAYNTHPTLRTILLSGTVSESYVNQFAVQPDYFLAKPYPPAKFVTTVKTTLGPRP